MFMEEQHVGWLLNRRIQHACRRCMQNKLQQKISDLTAEEEF